MEAERPVGRHEGPAHQLRVLRRHLLGGRAQEHEQVQNTSDGSVCDTRSRLQDYIYTNGTKFISVYYFLSIKK